MPSKDFEITDGHEVLVHLLLLHRREAGAQAVVLGAHGVDHALAERVAAFQRGPPSRVIRRDEPANR